MNSFRQGVLLSVLLFSIACRTDAFEPRSIFGYWQVADVYCSSCELVDRSNVGLVIHMAERSVTDPLAGGRCPGNVGYREVPPTTSLQKDTIKKINPNWMGDEKMRLRWVAVTCRDLDFMLLMILPDGTLGYVSEGEISYRLVRKQQQ